MALCLDALALIFVPSSATWPSLTSPARSQSGRAPQLAGSDEGGRRAAAVYSLIEKCKLNDVDPRAWLAGVLAKLPDPPRPSRRRDDALDLEGRPRRRGPRPVDNRRAQLGSVFAGVAGILFSEAIEAEGAIVFQKAVELGLEGIVRRCLGGGYWSGRVRNWLKVKTRRSRDDEFRFQA